MPQKRGRPKSASTVARLGGRAVLEKYGPEYYKELGRRSGRARRRKARTNNK